MASRTLVPSGFSSDSFESWFENYNGIEMGDIEHLAKLTGRRKDNLSRIITGKEKIFKDEYIEFSSLGEENSRNGKQKGGRKSKRFLLTKRGYWLLVNELDYREDPVDVQFWIIGFKKYCIDCGIAVQEGRLISTPGGIQVLPRREERDISKDLNKLINSEIKSRARYMLKRGQNERDLYMEDARMRNRIVVGQHVHGLKDQMNALGLHYHNYGSAMDLALLTAGVIELTDREVSISISMKAMFPDKPEQPALLEQSTEKKQKRLPKAQKALDEYSSEGRRK